MDRSRWNLVSTNLTEIIDKLHFGSSRTTWTTATYNVHTLTVWSTFESRKGLRKNIVQWYEHIILYYIMYYIKFLYLSTKSWRCIGEQRYSSTHSDLGTTSRWVVSFTHRPLYPQEKSPWYPLDSRLLYILYYIMHLQINTGGSFQGAMHPLRETDHSPPSKRRR
jgi:hypothetical protein